MSYSIAVYAVDINKIKQVCGSNDQELLATIKRQHAERLEDADEWFVDEIKAGAPSLFDAVSALVLKQEMNKDFAFQYGYALEVLCNQFGQQIDSEFESMSGGYFWELPDSIQSLVTTGAPVVIPAIEDFPTIGHKSLSDVRQELGAQPKFDPDSDEGEAFKHYVQILQSINMLNTDLIAFYY
ncbi:MAG: hypothetical protein SGJ27_13130 [Candidatus Melainabacteria bacterium]|nr:hypothetical protein [Candidatus Melainabacteria bacterium]